MDVDVEATRGASWAFYVDGGPERKKKKTSPGAKTGVAVNEAARDQGKVTTSGEGVDARQRSALGLRPVPRHIPARMLVFRVSPAVVRRHV